ncbi:hypothetical protein ACFZC6_08380 [Streptomyces ossamyceticus]|uniref:hypothetical protein n=1 Tax=Streptomyces ossamyceticus TaxID=249581 RepID=UPI0036E44D44
MNRDHGRLTVLFGREYEWLWEDDRLTLAPNFWQLNRASLLHPSVRPWFDL